MKMTNLKLVFLCLIPLGVQGQIANTADPRLKIDYWLKRYTQVTRMDQAEMAQKVFANLLAVADKPIGVLPKLYIFSNLEFQKVFALPDGSIVLPLSVIDFCAKSRKDVKARLAFLLGHELKHTVRDDYWIQRIFEFTSTKETGRDNKEMQRLWETMEWDLSQPKVPFVFTTISVWFLRYETEKFSDNLFSHVCTLGDAY